MTITAALTASLASLDLRDEDQAAVALAKLYADQLDGEADPVKLGPALLSVLESLGMSPRGRAAIVGKGVSPRDGAGRSKLDELRERRAARQRDTAGVDSTSG